MGVGNIRTEKWQGLVVAAWLAIVFVVSCSNDDVSHSSMSQIADYGELGAMDVPAAVSISDVAEFTFPSIVQVEAARLGEESDGSGVIYSSDGLIVTSWHVIEDSTEIDVTLHDGKVFDAELLRDDPDMDIAVIAIDSDNLRPATFGDSSALRIGEDVISIGHSFGLSGEPSVSRGIVSGLNRVVADSSGNVRTGLIQTDAAINAGSSGGALVNVEGEVIGINVGLIDLGNRANFALNSNSALESAERLMELGARPQPGYLGVGGVAVTPLMASRLALPINGGFGVRYIDPESPAARNLQVDDVIVNIDDTPIRDAADFTEFLRRHPMGTDVVVTAVRKEDGVAVFKEIPVTLSSPGA